MSNSIQRQNRNVVCGQLMGLRAARTLFLIYRRCISCFEINLSCSFSQFFFIVFVCFPFHLNLWHGMAPIICLFNVKNLVESPHEDSSKCFISSVVFWLSFTIVPIRLKCKRWFLILCLCSIFNDSILQNASPLPNCCYWFSKQQKWDFNRFLCGFNNW